MQVFCELISSSVESFGDRFGRLYDYDSHRCDFPSVTGYHRNECCHSRASSASVVATLVRIQCKSQ